MNQETVNILFNFLPETALALTAIIINVSQGVGNKSSSNRYTYYIFVLGILLSAIFSLMQVYYAPQQLFNGTIAADHFSYGGRVLITSAMLLIALAFYHKDTSNDFSLVLVSVIGALLSVSSANIFVLFISLQVMVIPLYLMIHYAIKPAIKYFIFSSLLMAILLYGFSLIYGITGSGNFTQISGFLSFNPYNNLVMIITVILITSGFAFLTLLAPLNLSFPLLAGRIQLPHLAQFAVINVVAMVLVIARFFMTCFHDSNTFITEAGNYNLLTGVNWQLLLAIISAISIIAGNLVILWQYELKKIAAYIIISQAGYILIGILSGTPDGISAMIFNLIVLIINSIGLLYCIKLISNRYNVSAIDGLKCLGKNDKLLFLSFLYFLISSAGFPLSAGFSGKIMLYISLGNTSFFWLIASGILSSSVFLYFIFKLSLITFSGKNTQKPAKFETLSVIILLILLIPNILLGFYTEPVLNWVKYCTNFIGI